MDLKIAPSGIGKASVMEQCPGLGIAREEVGQPDSGMIVRNLECGEERRYAGGVHDKKYM